MNRLLERKFVKHIHTQVHTMKQIVVDCRTSGLPFSIVLVFVESVEMPDI